MVSVNTVEIDGREFTTIHVPLPKTNLLVVQSRSGYVMCGALDVELLRTKLADRGIIAARAVGVKTMEELINGVVESCTQTAEAIGISPGMTVKQALVLMSHNDESQSVHL